MKTDISSGSLPINDSLASRGVVKSASMTRDHPAVTRRSSSDSKIRIPAPVSSLTEPVKRSSHVQPVDVVSNSRIKGLPTANLSSPSSELINRTELPEGLASTFDYIIGQLDMISSTMVLLDKRMSLLEGSVSVLNTQSRGITAVAGGSTVNSPLSAGVGTRPVASAFGWEKTEREVAGMHSFVDEDSIVDANGSRVGSEDERED